MRGGGFGGGDVDFGAPDRGQFQGTNGSVERERYDSTNTIGFPNDGGGGNDWGGAGNGGAQGESMGPICGFRDGWDRV